MQKNIPRPSVVSSNGADYGPVDRRGMQIVRRESSTSFEARRNALEKSEIAEGHGTSLRTGTSLMRTGTSLMGTAELLVVRPRGSRAGSCRARGSWAESGQSPVVLHTGDGGMVFGGSFWKRGGGVQKSYDRSQQCS